MNTHPLCSIFPVMGQQEFAELVKDIKANGQLDPIITHEDLVLDGRNRLRACEILRLEPVFREWAGEGGTPLRFVIARNLKRRHLDAGQRAALATELLPLLEAEAKERQRAAGGDRRSEAKKSVVEIIPQPILEPDERNPPARDEAASLAEANPRYVSDAKRIKEEAPEVFEKVKAGEINIPAAKRKIAAMNSEPAEMRQPPKAAAGWAVKQFDRIVEKHDNDEIRQLCELLAGFLGLSLGG